jgi:hypothetical protein
MKIILDINKSVEENAGHYFQEAKKARKKILGVKRTLETFSKKQQKESLEITSSSESIGIKKIISKQKYWFEKFKWFISSEGFLVVAARDATTNEILIKKHLEENDIVLHTDMAGSPFVVIKKNTDEVKKILNISFTNKDIGEQSINEAGSFTFVNSKAWKSGIAQEKVFYINPSQISKTAQSGEYLTKGAFMIRGEKNYLSPSSSIAIGITTKTLTDEPLIIVGPISALETYCDQTIIFEQGNQKSSDLAFIIQKTFENSHSVSFSIQEITHILPSGIQIPKKRLRKDELKRK